MLVAAGPATLKDSGVSSQREIRIIIPVENPIPMAIIVGFSPSMMASRTPIRVVPPDKKASTITTM
jgi:hypothetical protein